MCLCFSLSAWSFRLYLVCIFGILEIPETMWWFTHLILNILALNGISQLQEERWVHYISCLNCYTHSLHPQVLYMNGEGGWVLLYSGWMHRAPVRWPHSVLSRVSCNPFPFILSETSVWLFPGLHIHISVGISRHLRVTGLHTVFCSWQGRQASLHYCLVL